MESQIYTVMFDCYEYYGMAVEQVAMAKVATTALYGVAAVRLEAFYWQDDDAMTVDVDASTEVGRTMLRIFVTMLESLIGEQGFSVCQAPYQDVIKIDQWKESGIACQTFSPI